MRGLPAVALITQERLESIPKAGSKDFRMAVFTKMTDETHSRFVDGDSNAAILVEVTLKFVIP